MKEQEEPKTDPPGDPLVNIISELTSAIERQGEAAGALGRQVKSIERLLEGISNLLTEVSREATGTARAFAEEQGSNGHAIRNLDHTQTMLVEMVRLTLRKIAPIELAEIEAREALYVSQLDDISDMRKTKHDKGEDV